MSPRTSTLVAAALSLTSFVHASPTPTTPVGYYQRRQLSSITSEIADIPSDVGDAFSSIGNSIPTEAASGIIPGLDSNIPSADDVKSKSGLNDTEIEQLPIEVLNIAGYANSSGDSTWNLFIHGQATREPLWNKTDTLDDAASAFIPDGDINDLTPDEQTRARNLTSAIFSLPVTDLQLSFTFSANDSEVASLDFPYKTDSRGEFNQFVSTKLDGFNSDSKVVQRLDVHSNVSDLGNSSMYLVPSEGLTFVADIDDILRVTKIYAPKQGLNNSFVKPFAAWENMPEIFAEWEDSISSAHFHYLTTTPEPATRFYEEFIFSSYPLGSFDTRPYNFTTVDQTFSVRNVSLTKLFQSFPQRKFVLIADTSNADVMKDYPQLAKDYPGSVQCILLRNTSATDSEDLFPYDTSGFEGVDNSTYFFFNVPDDLKGLDIENGECVNSSVPQGVTFGYQNLPFDDEGDSARIVQGGAWAVVFSLVAVLFAQL